MQKQGLGPQIEVQKSPLDDWRGCRSKWERRERWREVREACSQEEQCRSWLDYRSERSGKL